MAQMRTSSTLPPSPKLDPFGYLGVPEMVTEQESPGSGVHGKGQCATCHIPQTAFMDDGPCTTSCLTLIGQTVNDLVTLPNSAIKTFTLRGIEGTAALPPRGPPHDARRYRRFSNLVLGLNEPARKGFARAARAGAVRRNAWCVCSRRSPSIFMLLSAAGQEGKFRLHKRRHRPKATQQHRFGCSFMPPRSAAWPRSSSASLRNRGARTMR